MSMSGLPATLLFLMLFGSSFSEAVANSIETYEVVLADVRQRTDDLYVDRENPHPHFYPIGFSPKGEFAYALTETECECDPHRCYYDDPSGERAREDLLSCDPDRFVAVVLINLITDARSSLPPRQARDFIIEHDVLEQDVTVRHFPIEHQGDRYHVLLEGRGGDWAEGKSSSPIEESYVRGVEGFISSHRHGTKRFTSFIDFNDEFDDWTIGTYAGFRVAGYVKSPYEERVAIVLGYGARIQHGSVPRYLISGAHLERGFSSK